MLRIMGKKFTVNQGDKFNHLTVIGEVEPRESSNGNSHRQIKCKCVCGNIKTLSIYHLIHGGTKDCGCMRLMHQDLVGKKFNRLRIIKEVEPRVTYRKNGNIKNSRMVEVVCDCGAVKTMQLQGVIRGRTQSCGCIGREQAHNKKKVIYGVGINDYSGLVMVNKKPLDSYIKWRQIIERCYSPKALKRCPTYSDCTVCDDWQYFTNFKAWFDENYIEGYELDKDILVKGNRVYSPHTCCFVPHRINGLLLKATASRGKHPLGIHYSETKKRFIACINKNGKSRQIGAYLTITEAFNAYKTAKEAYIKEVATEYYKDNKISKNVYDALMTYEVEITD